MSLQMKSILTDGGLQNKLFNPLSYFLGIYEYYHVSHSLI